MAKQVFMNKTQLLTGHRVEEKNNKVYSVEHCSLWCKRRHGQWHTLIEKGCQHLKCGF